MTTRRCSDEDIVAAVRESFSIAQVLRMLGLSPTGCNYKGMHTHFKRLSLNTSHFTGQGHLRGKSHCWTPRRPLSEILVEHSTCRNNSKLKRRLIKEGLLHSQCYLCGLEPIWQGKPLVLVLDHINGDTYDYRIENLRLLCPNCNRQQSTFAGKNKGRYRTVDPGQSPAADSPLPRGRARGRTGSNARFPHKETPP